MQWWLNVLFLVNGVWVLGSQFDGWGALPLASEQICIERKLNAERACRTRPLAYPTVWICTPDKPLVEIPEELRGVNC